MQHSPLSNVPLTRVDGVIASAREQAQRREDPITEGIPTGASGSGASANPKDLRVETGSIVADTESWDRNNPGVDLEGNPYTGCLTYANRYEWDPTTGKLLRFRRTVLEDTKGNVVSRSVEELSIINEALDCVIP